MNWIETTMIDGDVCTRVRMQERDRRVGELQAEVRASNNQTGELRRQLEVRDCPHVV